MNSVFSRGHEPSRVASKTIVILGAQTTVGKTLARELSQDGNPCLVFVGGLNDRHLLEEVAHECEEHGAESTHVIVSHDLGKESALDDISQDIVESHASVDMLINISPAVLVDPQDASKSVSKKDAMSAVLPITHITSNITPVMLNKEQHGAGRSIINVLQQPVDPKAQGGKRRGRGLLGVFFRSLTWSDVQAILREWAHEWYQEYAPLGLQVVNLLLLATPESGHVDSTETAFALLDAMKTAMAKDPKDLPQEIPVRVPATTPQAFAHATPLQRQQSRDIKTAARDIADRLLAPMGSNEWADDRSDVMSVRIEMSERWNVDGALQQLADADHVDAVGQRQRDQQHHAAGSSVAGSSADPFTILAGQLRRARAHKSVSEARQVLEQALEQAMRLGAEMAHQEDEQRHG